MKIASSFIFAAALLVSSSVFADTTITSNVETMSSVGGSTAGSSDSSARMHEARLGYQGDRCVGPVSYCNIYFGN